MSLPKRLDVTSNSRWSLVLITILIALGCTAGLLLSDHRAESSSRRLVHVKYHISNSAADPANRISLSAAYDVATSAQPIPKVLHHVYLDGLDSLQEAEQLARPYRGQRFPGYNHTVRQSCPLVHNQWEYKFWNNSQAEDLIQASYPWFLDTFRSYETNVQRDHLLSGRDIVLQLETESAKSLNNAVMASVPGHPFWMEVIQLMLTRSSITNSNFFGFKHLTAILDSTGPNLMREAFKRFSHEAGDLQSGWAGEWNIKDSKFQVYPLGQWFEPCKWDDYKCHQRVQAAQHLPPELVGHHINAGTWLKDMKAHNRKLMWRWGAGVSIAATFACLAYWLMVPFRSEQRCRCCRDIRA